MHPRSPPLVTVTPTHSDARKTGQKHEGHKCERERHLHGERIVGSSPHLITVSVAQLGCSSRPCAVAVMVAEPSFMRFVS